MKAEYQDVVYGNNSAGASGGGGRGEGTGEEGGGASLAKVSVCYC